MPDIHSLIDRYGDYLFRFALFRTGDRAVAEDLVQETYIAAWKARDSFKAASSEKTWLVGILKHKLFDYYRNASSGITGQIDHSITIDGEFNRWGAWKVAPEKWEEAPDKELDLHEFTAVLRKCLEGLSLQQRQVFVLREIDGYSTTEICNESGVSTTNLWVLLHRARMGLRKCLTRSWFGEKREHQRHDD
jgi:RNA polymerase sigma-70 factor (TIGR02943 family)